MKLRVFFLFVLTIGLTFTFPYSVTAQVSNVENSKLNLVTDNSSASLGSLQEEVVNNIYLPVIFKNFGSCSTIPTLLSPVNESNLNTLIPLFQWDSGNDPNATSFRLQIAEDPEFAKLTRSLMYGNGTGEGQFLFPNNLSPSTTYFWRAWLMCNETEGHYTDVWSFTTGSGGTILSAPTLLAPTDDSTPPSVPIYLQWSAVGDAVEYIVHWRKLGGGLFYESVSETQTEFNWFDANTTYEWWVTARNDYAMGEDSETWQFTTPANSSSSLSTMDLNTFIVKENGTSVKNK